MHAGGHRFDSGILHELSSLKHEAYSCKQRFIDILGRSGHILRGVSREVKEETRSRIEYIKDYEGVSVGLCSMGRDKQKKGVWGMPRLSEATKDVISCEKPRGGAHDP